MSLPHRRTVVSLSIKQTSIQTTYKVSVTRTCKHHLVRGRQHRAHLTIAAQLISRVNNNDNNNNKKKFLFFFFNACWFLGFFFKVRNPFIAGVSHVSKIFLSSIYRNSNGIQSWGIQRWNKSQRDLSDCYYKMSPRPCRAVKDKKR